MYGHLWVDLNGETLTMSDVLQRRQFKSSEFTECLSQRFSGKASSLCSKNLSEIERKQKNRSCLFAANSVKCLREIGQWHASALMAEERLLAAIKEDFQAVQLHLTTVSCFLRKM